MTLKSSKVYASLILLLGFTQIACKASNRFNRGSGSTSTSFVAEAGFQLGNIAGAGDATQIFAGKFTNDVFPDVVVLTKAGGAYFYENNDGTGWNSRVSITITQGENYSAGVARDLDLDGLLDLALFLQSTQLHTLRSNGDGTFSNFTTFNLAGISSGRTVNAMAMAPFVYASDADPARNKAWIFAATSLGESFYANQSLGNWTAGSLTSFSGTDYQPEDGTRVVATDFGGDNYQDFALMSRSAGRPIYLIRNTTDTSFSSVNTISPPSSATNSDLISIDLEGDTKQDLLLATSSGLQLYVNEGDYNFTESTKLRPATLGVNAISVLAADFTQDRNVDFFLTRDGANSVFYSQVNELIFENQSSEAFQTGALAESGVMAASADLDNDGDLDILELFLDGSVNVYINQYEN